MDRVRDAMNVLDGTHYGILSTHSVELEGYPFGSLVDYYMLSVDKKKAPVFLMSDLAQHSVNCKQNAKVSLTVLEQSDSPLNSGRITWIGDILQRDDLIHDFLKANPSSEKLAKMKDFHAYTISCRRVRYIGGFGKIFWIEPEDLI